MNIAKNKTVQIAFVLILFVSLVVPLSAFAQLSLPVPIIDCGIDKNDDGVVSGGEIDPTTGKTLDDEQCHWQDLVGVAQNIVDFLVALALFFAIGLFTYAGFLYVTAGGQSGKLEKAHKIFRVTIVGFILTLGAWLIVNFILTTLGVPIDFNLLR